MRNAYTTWPGGVDPTVPLFNTDNQKFGGARRRRKSRKASRRSRKSRRSNKNKAHKARRSSRKTRHASRSRRHRGGYATCSPVNSGSGSIPMTASVCPEGYFQDKGLFS